MSDLSPECAPKRTSTDRSEFMGSRQSNAASVGGRRVSRVLKETTPALDRAEAVLRECRVGRRHGRVTSQIANRSEWPAVPVLHFGQTVPCYFGSLHVFIHVILILAIARGRSPGFSFCWPVLKWRVAWFDFRSGLVCQGPGQTLSGSRPTPYGVDSR
jgi:hypothetical protein